MSATNDDLHSLSIVIPLFDEADNVARLIAEIHEAMSASPFRWELICVDDGSRDSTWERIQEAIPVYGNHIKPIQLSRNFGQTAAMQAGIDHASGRFIATLDGDLQNDPRDIPRMAIELIERDLDLLQGWRRRRRDGLLLRRVPSRIANLLIAKFTGVALNDYGCSLKTYRASMIKQIRLFGEMHRFIPVWAAMATRPSRIGETEVNHRPRASGRSKYGISRTFRVLPDLLAVFFFLNYRSRPGHFFGSIGLTLGAIGSLVMVYLMIVKFGMGEPIGDRPLMLVGFLCLIASVQFLTTGVLAELLSRTFYESQGGKGYTVQSRVQDNHIWKESTSASPD